MRGLYGVSTKHLRIKHGPPGNSAEYHLFPHKATHSQKRLKLKTMSHVWHSNCSVWRLRINSTSWGQREGQLNHVWAVQIVGVLNNYVAKSTTQHIVTVLTGAWVFCFWVLSCLWWLKMVIHRPVFMIITVSWFLSVLKVAYRDPRRHIPTFCHALFAPCPDAQGTKGYLC